MALMGLGRVIDQANIHQNPTIPTAAVGTIHVSFQLNIFSRSLSMEMNSFKVFFINAPSSRLSQLLLQPGFAFISFSVLNPKRTTT